MNLEHLTFFMYVFSMVVLLEYLSHACFTCLDFAFISLANNTLSTFNLLRSVLQWLPILKLFLSIVYPAGVTKVLLVIWENCL